MSNLIAVSCIRTFCTLGLGHVSHGHEFPNGIVYEVSVSSTSWEKPYATYKMITVHVFIHKHNAYNTF